MVQGSVFNISPHSLKSLTRWPFFTDLRKSQQSPGPLDNAGVPWQPGGVAIQVRPVAIRSQAPASARIELGFAPYPGRGVPE